MWPAHTLPVLVARPANLPMQGNPGQGQELHFSPVVSILHSGSQGQPVRTSGSNRPGQFSYFAGSILQLKVCQFTGRIDIQVQAYDFKPLASKLHPAGAFALTQTAFLDNTHLRLLNPACYENPTPSGIIK